jgi:hypothetical protein
MPVLAGHDALSRYDDRVREELAAIVVEVRRALQEGMTQWLAVGGLLARAKQLLRKGDFGRWVESNGMDRHNASRFITAHELSVSLPAAFSSTLRKIGQEKAVLLARLPVAKRLEILEHGAPVNGRLLPLESVPHRHLSAHVRALVGKSARGRKPHPKPEPRPASRWGLPIDKFDAFQCALKGLHALVKPAKAGWTPEERPGARALWRQVVVLYQRLEDHGMHDLLDARKDPDR